MQARDSYVSDRRGRPKGSPHVLFVDDEPQMRQVVRSSLEGAGYRVTTCSHATEAMAFYREHHHDVDLVIVDMLMPGMSGLDALKRMKSVDPEARIVLASAYVPDQDSDDVMLHGFTDFLHKPFRTADLVAMAARYTGSQAEVVDET